MINIKNKCFFAIISILFLTPPIQSLAGSKRENNILEIKQYVDSIKSINTLRCSISEKRFMKFDKEDQKSKNVGGASLRVCSDGKNKKNVLIIKYHGGRLDEYFYEDYYLRKGKICYAKIQVNRWSDQKEIWSSEYYIYHKKIIAINSESSDSEKRKYLKEYKKRKKVAFKGLKNHLQKMNRRFVK